MKMKMKKLLSLILAAVMTAATLPVISAAADDEGLLLWYDFKDGAKDASGNGLDGTLMNGASVSNEKIYFDGNDDYLKMPDGIVKDCTDITVSMYVKPEIENKNQFTWTFGNNSTVYMFLGTCNGGGKTKWEITNSSWSGAQTLNSKPQLAANKWHHVVLTIKDKTATVYADGSVLESRTVTLTPKDLGATTANYLAKSQYGDDPCFKGSISDFRVYSTPLGEDRIKQIGEECARSVEANKYGDDFPNIGSANRITENLSLPVRGESTGSAIKWKSSDESVIKPDGTVVRPAYGEGRRNVTLTAEITAEGREYTKEYSLTVLPETTDGEYGYLLAYFTGNSPEQERMSYALSRNGYDFYALNQSEPVFKANGGTGCMRDPYIFKGEDGRFYCIATDMKSNNGWSSQSTIFTWESADLINWTKERIIDFKQFEGFEQCNRAWAPQAIWCPEKNQYMIYLALKNGNGETYMYRCYTDDFTSCTAPEKMFEFTASAIDGDIMQSPADNRYYMYFKYDKNLAISILSAETLSGEWTDTDPETGEVYAELPKEGMNVEGSAVYKLIGENIWNNLVDCYGNGRFMCLESVDMKNYSVLKYSANKGEADYYIDVYEYGKVPRHGSVITVSKAEYEMLENKMGAQTGGSHAEPILHYSFDNESADDESGNGNNGVLMDGAGFAEGVDGGRALKLDGKGAYVSLPGGIGAKCREMTVAAWIKADDLSGSNPHLFDIGNDTNKYLYLSPNFGGKVKASITTGGTGSQQPSVNSTAIKKDEWTHVAFTIEMNGTERNPMYSLRVYVNGSNLAQEAHQGGKCYDNTSLTPDRLGFTLNNYIGKSQFSADAYFSGLVDDFRIYDRALTAEEIGDAAKLGGTTVVAVGGKNVKGFNSIIDEEKKTVLMAVVPGEITAIEPEFTFNRTGTAVQPSGAQDFTSPVAYTFTGADGAADTWTVSAVEWGNSVLGEYGLFGDPNITVIDGKYYLYVTTDGVSGWRSTKFKAFSSTDLVHWNDEGVILDLDDVSWSSGIYGWAPTACEYNGKYYFYYSSGNTVNGSKDLAVAVADSPNGPFVDSGKPLVKGGSLGGQMIDSQVFIDDDGTPYLFWGNGKLYAAQLNEDMISFASDIKEITPSAFTEGIFVVKRDGRYHFTWSEGNTENENYLVRAGVSSSPMERPSGSTVILSKNKTNDSRIKCTAHHSIINVPGTDDWYICYHRFNIPTTAAVGNSRYSGSHREVAIDRLEFDGSNNIVPATATLEGVTEPVRFNGSAAAVVEDFKSLKKGESFSANVTLQNNDGDERVDVYFALYRKDGSVAAVDVLKDAEVKRFSGRYLEKTIALPEDGSGLTLKIMTWSSDGLKPVSNTVIR